jgi:hypothetical protein
MVARPMLAGLFQLIRFLAGQAGIAALKKGVMAAYGVEYTSPHAHLVGAKFGAPLRDFIPLDDLWVDVKASADPFAEETAMILAYTRKFCDGPPLNGWRAVLDEMPAAL